MKKMTKLSIDELLEKAEQKQKKPRRSENHRDVQRYIEAMKIETGTTAVPTYVIFYHYRSIYDGSHFNTKANKTVFFRTFGKRFPTYRKNKQRYYLINDFIQITDELLRVAKIYDKQHWQKKPRKKKSGVQLSGQEGNDSN